VHCAQGVRRTGMMAAAFERKVLGWDKARTRAAVLSFGHSHRTTDDVVRFIREYNPATGAVPTSQPASVE
jgi:protein tyrosine/serine phosphatase